MQRVYETRSFLSSFCNVPHMSLILLIQKDVRRVKTDESVVRLVLIHFIRMTKSNIPPFFYLIIFIILHTAIVV
jgi:hypothetical protein